MSHTTTSYVRVYPESTTSDKTSSLNSLAPETKDIIIQHFIKSEQNYTVRTPKIPFFSKYQSFIPQIKWIILLCARYIGKNSFFTCKHIQFKRLGLLSLLVTQKIEFPLLWPILITKYNIFNQINTFWMFQNQENDISYDPSASVSSPSNTTPTTENRLHRYLNDTPFNPWTCRRPFIISTQRWGREGYNKEHVMVTLL